MKKPLLKGLLCLTILLNIIPAKAESQWHKQTALSTDTDNPVLQGLPKDTTVQCDAVPSPATVTAKDKDDSPVNVEFTETKTSGNCPGNYTLTRTYSATDADGNSATHLQTITVEDTQAPVINGLPAAIGAYPEGCDYVLNLDSATATDNCGSATLTFSHENGTAFPPGNYQIVATATDACGNTSQQAFNLGVIDNQPPIVSSKPLWLQLDSTGQATITPEDVTARIFDNCGIASIEMDRTTFKCADTGQVPVTLTVTDVNGLITTATSTVIMKQSVEAKAKDVTVYLDENGEAELTFEDVDNGSYATCGIDSTYLNKTSYTCKDVKSWWVTMKVFNKYGDGDSTIFNVTVKDTIKPAALAKSATVYLGYYGEKVIYQTTVNNGSYDACGIKNPTINKTIFNCSESGEHEITLTVQDNNGNISTAKTIVTVKDTLAPFSQTQDTIIYLNESGEASILPEDVLVGVYENCEIDTIYLNKYNFDCSNIGHNKVNVYVKDIHGNLTVDTANVTIEDVVAPVTATKNLTVQLNPWGQVQISADQIGSGSSDACGIASMSLDINTFDCSQIGKNLIAIYVLDLHGNLTIDSAIVTVEDTTAPTILTKNITLLLNSSGVATINVSEIDNGSTDACGIDTMFIDQTIFSCSDIGKNLVTLTATDKNGNTSTESAVVTVEDPSNPGTLPITIQNSNLCLNQNVGFWFEGSWQYSGYYWSINGQEISNTENAQYYIDSTGTYEVKLQAYTNDQSTCQKTAVKTFEIEETPIEGPTTISKSQDNVYYTIDIDANDIVWNAWGSVESITGNGNTAVVNFSEYWSSGQLIVAQYTNSSGCYVQSKLPVAVSGNNARLAYETGSGISASPNPFKNNLNVTLGLAAGETAKVQLVNLQSVVVYEEEVSSASNITIKSDHLPNGIYQLVVIKGDTRKVEKVIKF